MSVRLALAAASAAVSVLAVPVTAAPACHAAAGAGFLSALRLNYSPGLTVEPTVQTVTLGDGSWSSIGNLALTCTGGPWRYDSVAFQGLLSAASAGSGTSSIAETIASGAGTLPVSVRGSGTSASVFGPQSAVPETHTSPYATLTTGSASLSYVRTGPTATLALTLSGVVADPDGGGPLPAVTLPDVVVVADGAAIRWPISLEGITPHVYGVTDPADFVVVTYAPAVAYSAGV